MSIRINWPVMAVTGLFFVLYILPLGIRPMVVPDEFRYAEIPREMLATGDFTVPHLDGLRYFEKPVLGYWINALSMKIFGENRFAVRFPSALAAGLTAFMVFMAAKKFSGFNGGILASAGLLTCFQFFGIGVFNVLDSIFSMFVTGAILLSFFAYMENKAKQKICFLALSGFFCGLAFLTKGFIAFALPVLVMMPFLIWEGRLKDFFKYLWTPVAVAGLVVLPWGLKIYSREPDFWNYFFWTEHIKRFLSDHPQHQNPFYFFIPVILAGAMPWTALLGAAIPGIKKTGFRDPFIRFAGCWFLFPFLFFSASAGKLATYILPCFPPLMILIAAGLLKAPESEKTFNTGAFILSGLVFLCFILIFFSQTLNLHGIRAFGEHETWKWVLAVAGLLLWSMLSSAAARTADYQKKLALFCCAPLCFMFMIHFIMPDQVKERKAPGNFLRQHACKINPDTLLVSDSALVHAVCWVYKRNNVALLNSGGELSYGLEYYDSRLLTINNFNKLAKEKNIILIVKKNKYLKYKNKLSKPSFEDINGDFVFAQWEMNKISSKPQCLPNILNRNTCNFKSEKQSAESLFRFLFMTMAMYLQH